MHEVNTITIKVFIINAVVWMLGGITLLIGYIVSILMVLLFPVFQLKYYICGQTKHLPSYQANNKSLRKLEMLALEEFNFINKDISFTIMDGDCELKNMMFLNKNYDDLYNDKEYTAMKPKCTVQYHIVKFSPRKESPIPRKKILLVHGVCAQPMGWKEIVPNLIEQGFDIFCLALPGFGYVAEPTFVWSFKYNECNKWLDFYGEYLKQLILMIFPKDYDKLILLGHSFGGNVCSHFCYTNPGMFQKLILVNAMALLPTLHELTPFWAIFFNHLPFYVMRSIGYIFNGYLFQIPVPGSEFFFSSCLEFALLTCSTNYGNIIASRFIAVDAIVAYWRGPYLFNKLLRVASKTVAICSLNDTISPTHSFKLFFDIAQNKNISLYVTSGGDHNSTKDNVSEFNVAINHIISNLESDEIALTVDHSINNSLFDAVIESYGWSVYHIPTTRDNIRKEYIQIREISNTKTCCNYYSTKNNEITEISDATCFGILKMEDIQYLSKDDKKYNNKNNKNN